MKNKVPQKIKIAVALACIFALILSVGIISAFATETTVSAPEGEMKDIANEFADYLVQDTVRMSDSYVGSVQYTVYYKTAKGAVSSGYEGTPIIIYSVNHPGIERIGTDSNINIINSMLDSGYVVVILDYLGNYDAVSPAIDNSSQAFRSALRNGEILKASVFPSGDYNENFLVPSGYNVLLNKVFWEIDKHSAEGTLEKIVENWNTDFRATKGSKLVKWVHTDGTRKETQKDFNGNDPVWYNASGSVDANGEYTYIKYTKALTVTDCVDPDGSFIDMNLYINIVYPTSPKSPVPVMSLANSSGYPTTSVTGADLRPHSNGFLYQGYANAVFDYLWEPMARSASWGYYDGSQGITGDHMNYALMMYNDKLVNTAAMRYLRYVSLSGGDTYNFDLNNFGVYGNSKGGWFSFLGEAAVQSELVDASKYTTVAALEEAINEAVSSFVPDRYYNGHHGETRYQENKGEISADGFTVKAGEKQPWLTYNGVEIISGCQLTNACNGSQQEDITAGHAPIFISGNMTDTYNAAYGYSVDIYNICRELDIPLLHFEVPIGHTLTSGQDMNYNVDTYKAYFDYLGFFLKDDAIRVAYISPMDNAGKVSVTDKIVIGFTGTASATEVSKITVMAGETSVSGSWSSEFGGTVWTFTPEELLGNTEYTVTVPADFTGTNGVAAGSVYEASFITAHDIAYETDISGDYYTLKAPALTDAGNSFVFRFLVSNEAANIANLYAVSAIGETDGELLGSVNLRGSGSYEIDITDYVAANSGSEITLLLTEGRTVGDNVVKNDEFSSSTINADISKNSMVTFTAGAQIDGKTALMAVVTTPSSNGDSVYYSNTTHLITYKKITGGEATSVSNVGRLYTFSITVYDTTDRVLQFKLNSMTNRTGYGTIDYDNVFFTVNTVANEWVTYTFDYRVYEPDYGLVSANNVQSLALYISPDGDTNAPVYLKDLKVTEHVTDISVKNAAVAEKNDGSGAYVAPVSSTPFVIYNGSSVVGQYSGWKAALGAYVSGYTIKLQCDYTLTDSDLSDIIGNFANVNLDLGGYTLTSSNTENSLIWAKATGTRKDSTAVNVVNGSIRLGRCALISYENSLEAGSGKVFNINFENVYIGLCDNSFATELISDTDTTSNVAIDVNIAFENCIFDLPDSSRPYDAMTVFPAAVSETLDINYSITGGSIYLTSQRWITISENAMIVEFFADSNGDYTSLIMPKSHTYGITGSYLNNVGYASYEASSESNNIVTYNLVNGASSTRYGIIPDEYLDAQAYPFVYFMDGNFIGAASKWSAVCAAAETNLIDDASDEMQLLLRRDYANENDAADGNALGALKGTLVIDLGGNALTRMKPLIDLYTTGDQDYTTNIVFKNGYLYSAGSAIGDNQCAASSTVAKNYVLTFENVTLGFADGTTGGTLMWVIWNNSRETVDCNTSMIFNDCTFDLTDVTETTKIFDFKDGFDTFNNTVKINGGSIVADDMSTITWSTLNAGNDSVTMCKGSDGKYTTLTLTSSDGTAIADTFPTDDGEYRHFVLKEGSDVEYELAVNENMTDYGAIPSEYADAEDYPFLVFDESGNVIGAYAKFYGANSGSSAIGKAKDYIASNVFDITTGEYTTSSYKAYILMRRDYEITGSSSAEYFNNIAQAQGEIVIDLGGYTLSQSSSNANPLIDATSKTWGGSGDANIFPSTYIFKNGGISVYNQPVLKHSVSQYYNESYEKSFKFEFDNVKFGYVEGATATNLLVQFNSSSYTYAADFEIALNDCEFDLTNAPAAATTTLFNARASNTPNTDVIMTVRGGKIIADKLSSLAYVNFYNTASSNMKFEFAKGINGEYTKLILASSVTPYTGTFPTADGDMYFVEREESDSVSTYYLEKLSTPYRTVPHATVTANPGYLSAIDYPFFIFYDGDFVGVCSYWRSAVDTAIGKVNTSAATGKTAEILMRRDYEISKTNTAGKSDAGSNFNAAYGTVVVDLGGYKITAVDTYFIDVYLNYNTTSILNFESSILVKNGTMENQRASLPMIGLGHANALKDGYSLKHLNFTFENVNFETASYAIIADFAHDGAGLEINLECNDCVFDFSGTSSGVTMFKLKTSKATVIADMKFSGCEVIANDYSNYSIYTKGDEDSALFGAGGDGNYLTVTQLSVSAAPTITYSSINGAPLSLDMGSASGEYKIYTLGEDIKTKYGYIPFKYSSTEDYPFAVFNEKGGFINVSASFYGANSSSSAVHYAKDYMTSNVWSGTSYGDSERAAFVVLRRDYTLTSAETYNNLAQVQGLLTIDLCANKLKAADSRVLFPATIKPWTGSGTGDLPVYPTEFKIINGSIEISNKALINFEAWKGSSDIDVSGKVFSYTFEDVDITLAGTSSTLMATYSINSSTPDAIGNPEVIFKNCTFDLTRASDKATMFDLGNGFVHTAVKVIGGEIITDNADLVIYTKGESTTSDIIFGMYEGFTKITLPAGTAAPEGTFVTEGGNEYVFVKHSSDDDSVTYILAPAQAEQFGVKANVTLYSDFIYNVYVPVDFDITSITLDGVSYTELSALEVTEIDGSGYYVLHKSMAASNAASEFVLEVAMTLDEKNVTGSWTMSIVKYAERVLAAEDSTDTEKALIRDMLSYIAASYEYFCPDSEVRAKIASIIGDDYDLANPPAMENAAANDINGGLKSATLELSERPAFIFYMADGYLAEDFTFKAGGKTLETEIADDGSYVRVIMYAYGMKDTISYEIANTEISGSYNIADYYGYAEDNYSDKVLTLVERLWKYSESASKYRDEVISK